MPQSFRYMVSRFLRERVEEDKGGEAVNDDQHIAGSIRAGFKTGDEVDLDL